ncbi:MAG: citramalate synthase [Armatimonadota bacterium]
MNTSDSETRYVEIFDTTLRDGSQAEGISFSVEDKLRIAQKLDTLGVAYIEGGWPVSNDKDREFFRRAREMQWQNALITAFGSTRRGGISCDEDANLRALVESGAPAVAIFGKSWDLHVTEALRVPLEENLRMIEESVAYLVTAGQRVIYDAEHFFDGYKANPEYALQTLEAAKRGGAQILVLCDTNGGSLPTEVARIVGVVLERLQHPVGIHAHNDSGCGVANSIAAVEAGASQVHGTINGYGERCGNANLCSVIPTLELKMGIQCLPDGSLQHLTNVSRFVDEIANVVPDDRQPYVGKSAFAHKGGIHVDAILKHERTYEHIRPELVGNERRVLISELSGASNVVAKAQKHGLDLTKGSPEARAVLHDIVRLENEGYSFESAEGSFELLLKKHTGGYRKLFDLLSFRVIIEKRHPDEEPITEATLKIRVGDEVRHTVGEGDGPVHALDTALRKALLVFYPDLDEIKLTDFKVRVINSGAGTAAKVRTVIDSQDREGRMWSTVGVSTNLIEASWQALVDSVEYGLLRQLDEGTAEQRSVSVARSLQ